jgi:amino acid adenylation domain-containing protein
MPTPMADFRNVAEQISENADNYPHSIAFSYGDRHLCYEELDRSAGRFAGHLAQLGVASGCTVAICIERSFDWIIAALGIMRAGAAYVPLDPAWPDARLRFAVQDSGATVLVARPALLDRLQVEARGVDPCRDAAAIAAAAGVERTSIQANSLAYVIYTSGSTGVPKGVEITHGNLDHLIRWHRDAFGVTRGDRASHLAGLGFDAAVWEIWPYLCAGATVCLAENAVRSSPDLIRQWMIRERVTIGFVPTVHAAPMMAMEWPAGTTLRFLLTGGDVLHRAPAEQLPFDVVNNYGPSECTVVATSSVVRPGSEGPPTIGHPITGTSVYLLNEDGQQVPDGCVGEIYIGGGGVGRGYRNLPNSAGRSFLADPFSGAPGARMYRTGDRGARRADGEIEFRGRLDRQTKIRGQRVELDEIGSILLRHPSIEFAAAINRISPGGENQIVAYVLPKENARVPTTNELQQHLLRSLPNYMIPAVFARLHILPVSANGKLDLTMLEPPTGEDLLEGVAAKRPATPIEEKLLAMVRKLLENDAIAAEDNFFLAGGHSLLGTQLLIGLSNTFGVDVTLRQLFAAPTVEQLAVLIEIMLEERRLALIWAELLGRKHVAVDDNFFDLGGDPSLVAALQQHIAAEFGQNTTIDELFQSPTVRQQAELTRRKAGKPTLEPGVVSMQPDGTRSSIFWIDYACFEDLAKVMGSDHPVLSVVLTGEDSASLGDAPTLESIAACLLRKILTAQSKGPYIIGGYCLGGIIGYEISSQLRAAGHEVALLVMVDAPNPAFLETFDSLTRKMLRAVQRGPRTNFVDLRDRLLNRFAHLLRTISANAEMRVTREKLDAAAHAYRPKRYDGKVLLLLASERPVHADFVPGWQAVVRDNLHTQYVDGHHRGLDIRSVADAILPHLISAADNKCFHVAPTHSCSRAVVQRANPIRHGFEEDEATKMA